MFTRPICAITLITSLVLTSCNSVPCRGHESVNGVCYSSMPETWSLPELEEREDWWLSLVGESRGVPVLSDLLVQPMDDFFYCGGVLPIRGCTLGRTLIHLTALPVCRSALAHEATHVLLASEGDADYDHLSPEWGPVISVESECPGLTGEWLEKNCRALRAWKVRPKECANVE